MREIVPDAAWDVVASGVDFEHPRPFRSWWRPTMVFCGVMNGTPNEQEPYGCARCLADRSQHVPGAPAPGRLGPTPAVVALAADLTIEVTGRYLTSAKTLERSRRRCAFYTRRAAFRTVSDRPDCPSSSRRSSPTAS